MEIEDDMYTFPKPLTYQFLGIHTLVNHLIEKATKLKILSIVKIKNIYMKIMHTHNKHSRNVSLCVCASADITYILYNIYIFNMNHRCSSFHQNYRDN